MSRNTTKYITSYSHTEIKTQIFLALVKAAGDFGIFYTSAFFEHANNKTYTKVNRIWPQCLVLIIVIKVDIKSE